MCSYLKMFFLCLFSVLSLSGSTLGAQGLFLVSILKTTPSNFQGNKSGARVGVQVDYMQEKYCFSSPYKDASYGEFYFMRMSQFTR